jgi:glycerol kinase
MTESPYYLALDQGSHASKAFIFDSSGDLAGSATVPVATRQPRTGWVEQDPEEIVDSLRTAIAQAGTAARPGAGALAAAGLAIQRSSVVCWDRETGAALSPVLSWQDRRNADWLRKQDFDPARLRQITGLVASPHYGASKLRWCLDHLPAVQGALGEGRLCLGPLASFVLHRLLEERPLAVDPANAARTLLWDVSTHDWCVELTETCGIPVECLPQCVPSRHAFGTLRLDRAEVPLSVATGDQSAALFAWGEPDTTTLFVNIGTGAFVQRAFAGGVPDAPRLLHGVVWLDGVHDVAVLEGTVNGAGAALQWLAGERGISVETLLEKADLWLEEVVDPPLFLNGVGGLGSPFWIADFPIGFSAEADVDAETAAVLESIVFLLQANIEAIERAAAGSHAPASRIIVSGGLARLNGLCQRLADRTGLPVDRPVATEATAQGLAWLLGSDRRKSLKTERNQREIGPEIALACTFSPGKCILSGADPTGAP